MKKKLLALLTCVLLLSGILSVPVLAENETVYVTIANAGDLVVKHEQIALTDADKDGNLTVNDVLLAAHDKFYEGGSASGYEAVEGQYGLSVNKLWGVENGGSYGYYINNVAAMGLADPVKAGDVINAYSYKDLESWSDLYTFFDKDTLSVKADETIELTLSGAGFDADWNPVTLAVKGAEVKANDTVVGTTDENGKVTFTLKGGNYIVTASSKDQVLVPPASVITVEAAKTVPVWAFVLLAVVLAALVTFIAVRRKNHEA